jgi:hypothetical protein
VTWATRVPTGYVVDLQVRFRATGSSKWGSWSSWVKGTSAASGTFTPTKTGTYDIEARLRDAASGRTSRYSPEVLVAVTA